MAGNVADNPDDLARRRRIHELPLPAAASRPKRRRGGAPLPRLPARFTARKIFLDNSTLLC